jgi:hypothetical protein
MGLGLSLCRTVIEQHGGALDFGPGAGRGTEFRFTLPAPRTAESGGAATAAEPSTRLSLDPSLGIPVVYLVDDEDVVRDALAWLLRSRRLLSEGFASAEAFEAWLAAAPAPACTDLAQRAGLPAAGRAHARHQRPGAVRAPG